MPLLLLCALFMLIHPSEIIFCTREACALFARDVLPGLFPFLTVMLLVTSRLKKEAGFFPMALMGMLAGSPAGARLSAFGRFTPKGYRAFALLTGVMSPMFLLGTVPLWLKGDGMPVFLASWLGALVTAGLSMALPANDVGFSETENGRLSLSEAVNRAAQTMLTVCGCMAIGSCLRFMISRYLPFENALLKALIQGLTEVTKGVKDLSGIPFEDRRILMAWTAALTSFGGVSLQMQNFSFYKKGALPMMPYLFLKGLHAALAFFIAYGLTPPFSSRALEAAAIGVSNTRFMLPVWGMAFLLSEIVLKWIGARKRGQRNAAHKQCEGRAGG